MRGAKRPGANGVGSFLRDGTAAADDLNAGNSPSSTESSVKEDLAAKKRIGREVRTDEGERHGRVFLRGV